MTGPIIARRIGHETSQANGIGYIDKIDLTHTQRSNAISDAQHRIKVTKLSIQFVRTAILRAPGLRRSHTEHIKLPPSPLTLWHTRSHVPMPACKARYDSRDALLRRRRSSNTKQHPHVIDERRAYEHVGYHDPQNTIPWGVIHSQQCFVQNGKSTGHHQEEPYQLSQLRCPPCARTTGSPREQWSAA